MLLVNNEAPARREPAMTEHSAVDDVVELLSGPDLLSLAATSPAVRASLRGMLDQVMQEIDVLTSLPAPATVIEGQSLGQCVRGREVIAALLREILETPSPLSG